MSGQDRIADGAGERLQPGGYEDPYRDLARRLRLPFVARINLGRVADVDVDAIREGTAAMQTGGNRILYLAPREAEFDAIRRWIEEHPETRERVAITLPTVIRAALVESAGPNLAEEAVARLARRHPRFSAEHTITRGQAAIGGALVAVFSAALVAVPAVAFFVLNFIAALFFFGVGLLRFLAAGRLANHYARRERIPFHPDDTLPVYTVLVPLLREERMVPALVAALDGLAWPADRLDVKLIVEADDPRTRRAVERTIAGTRYELIVVPRIGPRTKPKALAYALTFARGEFVTIYDAEDRPHPMQLREAHAVFRRSGPELACLQAPLLIDNPRASAITRYFTIEYSALFDGLLPALAAIDMPLPLGGTSNHFRRDTLEAAGGWDPFNVTEDADLGVRLARLGFRSDTLSMPTWEEAPASLRPWLNQRTRWFKGWLQTFLVHTRQPIRLLRDLGLRQLTGFGLIGIGMLISAIVHPIYLVNLALVLTDPFSVWSDGGVLHAGLIGINLFNLFAGYFAVMLLSWRTLRLRGRQRYALALFTLPFYWLLMSVACLRAIVELVVRPHHWDKTPHRGRLRAAVAKVSARTAVSAWRASPSSRRSPPPVLPRSPRRAF